MPSHPTKTLSLSSGIFVKYIIMENINPWRAYWSVTKATADGKNRTKAAGALARSRTAQRHAAIPAVSRVEDKIF